MIKFSTFFLSLIVLSGLLVAQTKQYKFIRLSVEEGLSSPYVTCLLMDQKGFLWVGTSSGLNRYDGYTFTTFEYDPMDPAGISHPDITALYEDRHGQLWVGTRGGGLNRFNPTTESFSCWRHGADNPHSLASDVITVIYETANGDLWIGTNEGLSRTAGNIPDQNEEAAIFTNFRYDPDDLYSLSHNFIRAIYEDKNGILWIGTERGGINHFHPAENKFYHRFNATKNDSFWLAGHSEPFVSVLSIYEEPTEQKDIIWIGTSNLVLKYNLSDRKFIRYPTDDIGFFYSAGIHYHSILKDQQGLLWIATQKNGLLLFDEKNQQITSLRHDYTDVYSLSHDWISTLYQDRNGAIWVGSAGAGLCQYDPQRWKFDHYPLYISGAMGKKSYSITAIFEDLAENGKFVWLGTANQGLLRYNREKNEIKQIFYQGRSDYIVSWIYQDPKDDDHLWIAYTGVGLLKFNKETEEFICYKLVSLEEEFISDPNKIDLISTTYLYSFIQDQQGNFWLASGLGLHKFEPANNRFTSYLLDPDNSESLSDNYVNVLLEDRSGMIWVGTFFGGLNLFDPVKNTFIRFQPDPENDLTIRGNRIRSLLQDKNGNVWIGTTTGLNRFNQSDSSFVHYGKQNGFAGISIRGIMEDGQGNLWFASEKGITQFNPETGECHNYDVHDGLQGYDFNSFAYHQNSRGEMFYGGQNGLNVFFPDSIQFNPSVPPVVLTDFKIFNQSVKPTQDSPLTQALTETERVILNHKQSVFSFEFAALDYTIPAKNLYAYQMEGVDKDWVYTDASRRFATYTQLKPGEYTFKVKASNNDGLWNEEGTSIRITILPPWWRSHLAYTLYVVLIVTALVLAWRFQLNRLKLKHQLELEHLEAAKLQEVDHLKSRFFANISHEFRTPLTLILGPLQKWLPLLKNQDLKQDLKMMERNANRLYRLINQLLDLSKLESGSLVLQAREENILQLLRGYVQSFESQARLKKITLDFKAELESIMLYVDRDKIEQIIYNLLSNAFKFTPAGGEITVSVKTIVIHNPPVSPLPSGSASLTGMYKGGNEGGSGEYIEISVTDTGRGIPPEKIDRIFDRFYQVDDSSVRDHEGSGIGLALTKELVELHHGKITVESVPGKGTTFTIWLPLGREHLLEKEIVTTVIEDSSQKVAESVVESEMVGGQKVRTRKKLPLILVVEDNSDVRFYIRGHLESSFAILEAANGKEGLKTAIEKIPDLIISDVMMPEMDGFEFCKKIKTDQRTSHIPVILLTARAASQDKIDGLETGADDYLIKPFDAKELQVRVKNLIAQREKLRIHYMQTLKLVSGELKVISADEAFLNKSILIADKHLSDLEYNIEKFAREIGFSYSQLVRKLESITGLSPSLFLRSRRLLRARQLLDQKAGNVAQIAYQCGFNNLSYFSRSFKEQFGQLPSEYIKTISATSGYYQNV